MVNPVNARLGRNDYAARAQAKVTRQKVNELVRDGKQWKRELAQSWLDLNPDDEFERAYETGEHSR